MNPFQLKALPPNIRLQRWWNGCLAARVLRALPSRLGRMLASLPGIPATGRMLYNNEHTIHFNGRNRQYHALYEDCYQQGYELETTLLISLLLNGSGTFVDAGANWGCFALTAAALPDFSGTTVCYEPNPATFADLESCVRQAGVQNRVRTRNVGLGSAPGTLRLQRSADGHSGQDRLATDGIGAVVQVTTLDAEALTDVRLIKVDVEGMELDVLRGAQHTISTQRPFLIVENFLHHDQPDLTLAPIRWLQAHDYAVFAPAAQVRRGAETLPLPYGSPAPRPGDVLDTTHMAFFPVTVANRYLLPAQLNLLGVPQENMASLPGHVLN